MLHGTFGSLIWKLNSEHNPHLNLSTIRIFKVQMKE